MLKHIPKKALGLGRRSIVAPLSVIRRPLIALSKGRAPGNPTDRPAVRKQKSKPSAARLLVIHASSL